MRQNASLPLTHWTECVYIPNKKSQGYNGRITLEMFAHHTDPTDLPNAFQKLEPTHTESC